MAAEEERGRVHHLSKTVASVYLKSIAVTRIEAKMATASHNDDWQRVGSRQ
jgi:hypothetical protein